MKKSKSTIFLLILGLAIVFYIFKTDQALRQCHNNCIKEQYIARSVVERMVKQCDIYSDLINLLNGYNEGLITSKELSTYVDGIEIFICNDLSQGAYDLTIKDNEIKRVLLALNKGVRLSGKGLANMSKEDISKLVELYGDLIEHISGEEKPLLGFLSSRDIDNSRVRSHITSIDNINSEIEMIIGKE